MKTRIQFAVSFDERPSNGIGEQIEHTRAARRAEMSWADLNKRQQAYLTAVYEVDQAIEQNITWLGSQGRWVNTPASQWRWMPYNASGSALLRKLTECALPHILVLTQPR
jgi:hypothetical protein